MSILFSIRQIGTGPAIVLIGEVLRPFRKCQVAREDGADEVDLGCKIKRANDDGLV
jgi:hypothetical protein